LSAGGRLAVEGGRPVRTTPLPYGHQWVDDDDVAAVAAVLRSEWLTTGPAVEQFERALAAACGTRHAVAVCNGTAALHAAMFALGVGPGDEVLVPAMTFAASANCAVFQGAHPVFCDVEDDTLLVDPDQVAARLTERTRAVVAVDYAGQPCRWDEILEVAARRGVAVVGDVCHALGGSYRGRPVGSLGRLNTHSFHPVKHVTCGEGGAVTTDDAALAERMRMFRNHGITTDFRQREKLGGWFYEMVDLGWNYRISDIQCALGASQLRKLPAWVARRRAIAARYDAAFADLPALRPLAVRDDVSHAYHLYVVRLELDRLRVGRAEVFAALRAEGIGVNVHYIPVHLHPYYRRTFGTRGGDCPVAEAAYERILSLPIFPAMSDADVRDVIDAVHKVLKAYAR